MTIERAMEILNSVIDYVCVANNTPEQIDKLVGMGFGTEELVDDFGYSLTDVQEYEAENDI